MDAGLGDGLHDPLPLVPGEYEQDPMRFVLARTADGIGDWHLRHDPTGAFTGMSFRAPEVGMDVFAVRHEFLSTSPESSFAGVVTAQLRTPRGTTILRGCVLTRRVGDDSTSETIAERADLVRDARRRVRHPPRCTARGARRVVETRRSGARDLGRLRRRLTVSRSPHFRRSRA